MIVASPLCYNFSWLQAHITIKPSVAVYGQQSSHLLLLRLLRVFNQFLGGQAQIVYEGRVSDPVGLLQENAHDGERVGLGCVVGGREAAIRFLVVD